MGDQEDKVTGMEKITTKPGQSPVAHFVSGLDECEKKTVVWEVRNIVELLNMSEEMNENGITFDAGHSIGIPATWYLYFTRAECATGLYAFLKLDADSKAKLVKAGCSISFSCEGEIFAQGDLDPKEFKTPLPSVGCGGLACLLTQPIVTVSKILEKTDNGQKALRVKLTLNVFSSKESVEVPKGNLLKAEDVVSDFEQLLESEDGADVEIKVPLEFGEAVDDDNDFYSREVHKTVLMARSTVFAKMFVEESTMIEARTGKVVIEDLSPQGLDIFLHYIYTGKVSDEWLKIPEEILNCAEKYDLGKLKQYCGHNLIAAATCKNAIDLYKVAKLHKLSFAKCAIAEFISKNLRAVLDDGEEPSEDEENAAE